MRSRRLVPTVRGAALLLAFAVAACTSGAGPDTPTGTTSALPGPVAATTQLSTSPTLATPGQVATTHVPTSAPPATTAPSTGVEVIRDIEYTTNATQTGKELPLTIDLVTRLDGGEGDRPLLILLGSERLDYDLAFAKAIAPSRGVAVALAEYREIDPDSGLPAREEESAPLEESGAFRTIQVVQDLRAAVRFFREDAATENTYGVDPDRIALGGHSVEAAMSAVATYLVDPAEAEPELREVLEADGGLDGGGSNVYDSTPSAWVGFAGALPLEDLDWITSASPPLMVVYGTSDEGIPTDEGPLTLGLASGVWGGSEALYERATTVGLTASQIHPIEGGDHMSAIDATNREMTAHVARFLKSL